ncbi:MAG: family 10 glycosylhydrolase [Candidatus Bathyarchaeota archaeon]
MKAIKIGVLTNKPKSVPGFDFASYYVKSCTGKICKPAKNLTNIISCFADNRTARKKPEWIPVSKLGNAIRTNRQHRFLWDYICPSVKEYQSFLFDLINETLKNQIEGIHLDCIGFPGSEFCTCHRCIAEFKKSQLDWIDWRIKKITDFIQQASKMVKDCGKIFSITLLPDPCFGKERFGEDFHLLEKYVDFFIVPIYDLYYSTTYWLETLAIDFSKQLDKPLFIELYAANPGPEIKNLLAAMVAISNYVDGIILATHDDAKAKQIQENILNNSVYRSFLSKSNCQPLIKILDSWRSNDQKQISKKF